MAPWPATTGSGRSLPPVRARNRMIGVIRPSVERTFAPLKRYGDGSVTAVC
jgi:hypothetical protein